MIQFNILSQVILKILLFIVSRVKLFFIFNLRKFKIINKGVQHISFVVLYKKDKTTLIQESNLSKLQSLQ